MKRKDSPKNPPGDTILSIAGLAVRSGAGHGRAIVEGISIDVRAGETVCVVGESGSGKSITSLAAMRLLPVGLAITQGHILLDGEDLRLASERRMRALRAAKIAMVFQEPMTALNPIMRVGAQVDEVLALHTSLGKTERRRKVLAMLERVGLPDVERVNASYPHQLSGGQRQRIVIAMALMLRPRLLIADEPTTALDVTTQKQVLSLVADMQREQGTAVLFVTHDFGVVSEIADEIVVMNRGTLVESGPRREVLERPRADYTRLLIGSVPEMTPRLRSSPSKPVVLEVSGLTKTFEDRRFLRAARIVNAARDVSFNVRRGEITGIIGESGSGKSTVARCIMGLTEATSGDVSIGDEPLSGLRRNAQLPRAVQYIFQDPYRSLNPRRTVGESIIEGLMNDGAARADAMRKAVDVLALVGLSENVLGRYPHQFSGGQRQRICIARAVIMKPQLLVADEAVSALDVSVQAQVLRLFESIRDTLGLGILFITHDLRVAAQICNSVVVMRHGEIVESGDAVDVLGAPTHEYTRCLIDAAPTLEIGDWVGAP